MISRIAFALAIGIAFAPASASAGLVPNNNSSTWQDDVTEWLWEHLPRTMEGFKVFEDWLAQLNTEEPPQEITLPPDETPPDKTPPDETIPSNDPVPPPKQSHDPVPPPKTVPPEPPQAQGNGADWYVDGSAGGGDGKSWETAWKDFNGIDWKSIKPGDTIHVSGNPSGKPYTGEVRPGASGEKGNPIIIEGSIEPGHTDATIYNDGQEQAAFFLDGVNNITIRGFTINTIEKSDAQTDGIYMQTTGNTETSGITIENNKITISNDGGGHNDCVQTAWRVTDLTIRNNHCQNKDHNNSQGFWLEGANGTFTITGNSINLDYSQSAAIGLFAETGGENKLGNKPKPVITDNTLVGGEWGTLYIQGAPEAVIKNNKFINSVIAIRLRDDDPPSENINGNLYTGSPSFLYHEGDNLSFQQWQGKGYDKQSTLQNQRESGS